MISIDYITVSNDEEYAAAKELFLEYANSLDIDLCFQDFDSELLSIKTMYGPPNGSLILTKHQDEYVGCAAIRKIDEGICELKRMYAKPAYRGYGIGNRLMEMLIADAQEKKYAFMRLDTLSSMTHAIDIYKSNGFYEITSYYPNPYDEVVYFERKL